MVRRFVAPGTQNFSITCRNAPELLAFGGGPKRVNKVGHGPEEEDGDDGSTAARGGSDGRRERGA